MIGSGPEDYLDAGNTGLAPAAHVLRWPGGVVVMTVIVWAVFTRSVVPLDLNVFLAGGHAVASGNDPYPALGTPFLWSGSAFVYPWLTAWLFAPAGVVSSHTAAVAMTALSVGAIALGVRTMTGVRLVPLICVLFSAPTLDGLQMGTLNAILFLGVCLAWRWRDHAVRVGFVIGVLVTLKVLCWPLTVWLLLTRRWGAAAWSAGVGTVLLGLGWTLGPMGPVSYARLLGQLSAHESISSSGIIGMFERWSIPIAPSEIIGLACAAGAIAVMSRRGDAFIYAATVVASLLATPVVWHHYYLLVAAPLLLIRNGAWWYLLVGWASVSARAASGVGWLPITLSADVVLALTALVIAFRRRDDLIGRFRQPRWRTLFLACGVLLTGLVCLVVFDDPFVDGAAPSACSVGACAIAIAIAAGRNRRPSPDHARTVSAKERFPLVRVD